MGNSFKRITAVLMSVTMVFSLLSGNVWAEGAEASNDAAVEAVTDSVELKGENPVGNLISDVLTQEAEEQYVSQWCVTALDVKKNTATVTYSCATSARLVVAAYDEETGQMCAAGSADVEAGEGSQKVKLSGKMPKYYIAKAFFVDLETEKPLCSSFCSNMHTKAMQELAASTVADFDEERVLNLDDNAKTNFLVYDEKVALLDTEKGKNTITEANDVYTIANADASTLALKRGDIFSCTDSEGNDVIVKVGKISKDGNTVTITKDDSLTLEDVFDTVKIDSTTSDGNTLSTQDNEHKGDASVSLVIDHEIANGIGKISGRMTISIEFRLYLLEDYREFTFSATTGIDGDVEVKGTITGNLLRLRCPDLSPCPGVYMHLEPTLVLRASGAIHPHISVTTTFGCSYDSINGWQKIYTPPHVEARSVEIQGTVFLGVDLKPEVTVLAAFQCEMTAEAGIELELSETLYDSLKNELSNKNLVLHDCVFCFSGPVRLKGEIACTLSAFFKVVSVDLPAINLSIELGRCYISYRQGDWTFGWGRCPYCLYKTVIYAKNKETGEPVEGCSITVRGLENKEDSEKSLVTEKDGSATTYLMPASYRVTGEKDKSIVTETLIVGEITSNVSDIPSVTLELEDTRRVTITATNSEGDLVEGATVTGTEVPKNTKTNENGFASYYVLPGEHSVTVYDSKSDSQWTKTFTVEAEDKNFDAKLEKKLYKVKVFVFDSEGNRVKAKVTCGDELDWSSVSPGYALFRLPNGTYQIHVENPEKDEDDVDLKAVVDKADKTLNAKLPKKHCQVTVTVLKSDGKPASGITIYGTGLDNDPKTNSKGKAVFKLLKGNYMLEARDKKQYAKKGLALNKDVSVTMKLKKSWMKWKLNKKTGELRIWGEGSMPGSEDWFFPGDATIRSVNISGLSRTMGGPYNFAPFNKKFTKLKIADSVVSIGQLSFEYCYKLKTVKLPKSVTSIEWAAFLDCKGLESVTIPKGVLFIGEEAFMGCTSLKSVSLPNSVISIDSEAFMDCTSLESITFPKKLEFIGQNVIKGCTSLKNINIPKDFPCSIGDMLDQCENSIRNIYFRGTKQQFVWYVYHGEETEYYDDEIDDYLTRKKDMRDFRKEYPEITVHFNS